MTSAKALFQATKPKSANDPRQDPLLVTEEATAPVRVQDVRDKLDFDPTPPEATWSFLAREGDRLREIGGEIWENAVGAGHIANVLIEAGFEVFGTDIVDRGWPGTGICGLEGVKRAPARTVVTNPPYNRINGAQSGGWWLQRCLDLDVRYMAFLLNWDWPLATKNGLGELIDRCPPSRAYPCRWKIDFRGGGSPPQRNGWFVWDLDGADPHGWRTLPMDRVDPRQGGLL